MKTLEYVPVPAFEDNYIWLISDGQDAIVVDPGDAAPVEAYLTKRGWRLTAILLTHHHHDHVGGVAKLLVSQSADGDIPVIGPCEAMFHIAAQLGERFGIVCYHESVIPRQITQTRYYGMEPWIAGRRASGFKLKDIGANRDDMTKNFMAAARALIDQDGADVIIVHGITQCPVNLKPDWVSKELGVPVVEGIGAPIRMAAMMAGLGLKHSRKRWPKSNAKPNV